MHFTPLKSLLHSEDRGFIGWYRVRISAWAWLGAMLALNLWLCTSALAAEYLAPMPQQTVVVGQPHRLGIRPSRQLAQSDSQTELHLAIAGLADSANFEKIDDDLWQLTWVPAVVDIGAHDIAVFVTEVDRPGEILQVRILNFEVIDAASTPDSEPKQIPEPKDTATPADEPVAISEPWTLAALSTHIVTPNQWVRFLVQLQDNLLIAEDDVIVEIDYLPYGASFNLQPTGGHQFEWQPGEADRGEHTFRFTAVERDNSAKRESVTVRIIVQEG